MPNWFTTTVTAKGNDEDLKRFKATHIVPCEHEGQRFDLNTVTPMPEVLKGSDSSYYCDENSPEAVAYRKRFEELKAETGGFGNWYDWCVVNWGDKWNTINLDVEKDEPGELKFCFDTAWAPPSPVIHKLRVMYPTIDFECHGFDRQNPIFHDDDNTFEWDIQVVAAPIANWDEAQSVREGLADLEAERRSARASVVSTENDDFLPF